MKALRKAITETLLELARKDARVYALASDSRGSVTLDEFARELPGQFVECGIAEQDAVGLAAGLASAGLIPFVCGPASFYAPAREQVKVDVANSHITSRYRRVRGISYGALGGTHHAVQDVALMPPCRTFSRLPSDASQGPRYAALAASPEPAYVRVGPARCRTCTGRSCL
jgi:transketolase